MGRGGLPVFPDTVHVPVDGGWVDSRIPDIARTLHAMSSGRLTLIARCDRRRGTAICYDLFERDSRGQHHWVMRFGLDEVPLILDTVRKADRASAGHTPVTQALKAHHEAKEQKMLQEATELTWEFADRVESTKRELESEPKTFFGQAGAELVEGG